MILDQLDIFIGKTVNLDHYLRSHIKRISCHTGDLSVQVRTTLLEENTGEDLHYPEVGKPFPNRTQNIKKEVDKLDYIKIRNFCSSKDTLKRIIRQDLEWEKIFADLCLTKDF